MQKSITEFQYAINTRQWWLDNYCKNSHPAIIPIWYGGHVCNLHEIHWAYKRGVESGIVTCPIEDFVAFVLCKTTLSDPPRYRSYRPRGPWNAPRWRECSTKYQKSPDHAKKTATSDPWREWKVKDHRRQRSPRHPGFKYYKKLRAAKARARVRQHLHHERWESFSSQAACSHNREYKEKSYSLYDWY